MMGQSGRRLILMAMALFISAMMFTHNDRASVQAYGSIAASDGGTAAQTTVPADPSDLLVTEVTSNSVSIAWTDNSSDETGFKIEWCTGSTCTDFQSLANMPAGVNSITQWNLGKNKTYRYRVLAYNSAGDSGYSNIVNATTLR